MFSLANLYLQSNTKIKINFKGGKISSDAGLLLLHEFVDELGLNQLKFLLKRLTKRIVNIFMMKFYCKKSIKFVLDMFQCWNVFKIY